MASIEQIANKLRACTDLPEYQLWLRIKDKAYKGYKFLRLQPLDKYIPDFVCKELKIIIEVEGDTHDLKYDESRYEQLKKLGYKVMRFTNQEIKKDLKKVLQRIYDYAEDYTR